MLFRSYIPYIQTNFVLGLDADEGAEPFELTKRFLNMTPGAFPAYSLLTAFGRAAALNLDYQRANYSPASARSASDLLKLTHNSQPQGPQAQKPAGLFT